ELSRTHSISYMGRPTAGWGSINCAGAGQPGRVWQARTAPGVAMLPGEAGINVRKTARYAGKDCDPLHSRLVLRAVTTDYPNGISNLRLRWIGRALYWWRMGTASQLPK